MGIECLLVVVDDHQGHFDDVGQMGHLIQRKFLKINTESGPTEIKTTQQLSTAIVTAARALHSEALS